MNPKKFLLSMIHSPSHIDGLSFFWSGSKLLKNGKRNFPIFIQEFTFEVKQKSQWEIILY